MSASTALTALTINIHQGRSMFNRRLVMEGLREAIRSVGADLVFLQEAVGEHVEMPAPPQYEYLADTIWHAHAYGRNAVSTRGHHGNALLSKHPIARFVNHDISVPGFEPRGLLHGMINASHGPALPAICVHLGLDGRERASQLARLAAVVCDEVPADAPLIVAGDFNDWRNRAGATLADCGLEEAFTVRGRRPARSFPAHLPLLRLDRIYLRGVQLQDTRVLAARPWSHLSDHAALVATVTLP